MRCSNRMWLVLSQIMLSAILAGLPSAQALSAELLPPDAPGITQPAEYSFGSATQSKDWRATVQVLDQLERRFGEKSVQILIRNLDTAADPQAIEAYYDEQLGQSGWKELPLEPFHHAHQAWSFALVSPDGRQVFAIEALDAAEGTGGIVPLNILTNLADH